MGQIHLFLSEAMMTCIGNTEHSSIHPNETILSFISIRTRGIHLGEEKEKSSSPLNNTHHPFQTPNSCLLE